MRSLGKVFQCEMLMLANQVLDAVRKKATRSSLLEAETTYNAVIAALNDICPMDALEGMLAAQLIATHMAAMDCHERLNTTNDRPTHGYNLNQGEQVIAYLRLSAGGVEPSSR